MSRQILKHGRAQADIVGLARYIASDSVEASDRFVEAVDATLDQLASNPGMGNFHRSARSDLAKLRIWRVRGFPRHVNFYRDLDDRIEIIRVLHASTAWEGLL